MFYTVITWPRTQELMLEDGFEDHSYLVSDNKGIKDFGSSAYFVDIDWLMEVENKVEMTEERYQYLNSLSLEEYDNETSEKEQEAFCNYQHKYHPDEVIYYQGHNPD